MVKKRTNTRGNVKPAEAPKARDKNSTVRKVLLEMRERLLAGGPERDISESLRMPRDDIRDEADQAGAENSREVSILLSTRNKGKVLAIDAALKKIQEGNYGICEECSENIGAGRLKAMPLARYCTACQSQVEKEVFLDNMGKRDLQARAFVIGFEGEETD